MRVIREENGVRNVYVLDLRSTKDIFNSPAFYVMQNDLIYVEPNAYKARQSTVNGNTVLSASFWVSIASLATSLLVYINQMVK